MIEPALAQGAWRVELLDGQLLWRAPEGSALQDSHSEPAASLALRMMLGLIGPLAPDEML
jgi:hypothetical protein